ncbi:hypothetical protein D3C83_142500 [compost metagenome]
MEATILEKETRRDELRAWLADPSTFKSDPKKAELNMRELQKLDEAIEKLYARWQILSDMVAM